MSISGTGSHGPSAIPGGEGPTSHSLGEALLDDHRGIVSERDAANIVAKALGDIARATDPAKAFAEAMKVVASARHLVGFDEDAKKILDDFEAKGKAAVDARLAAGPNPTALPMDARGEFVRLVRDTGMTEDGDPVTISNVRPDGTDFEFEWKAGEESGKALALPYGGRWFFSPEKVETATLDLATDAFRRYFDDNGELDLRLEHTGAEIDAMRAAILPTRAMFPGEESDPYGYVAEYPLVLVFENPTGSDHGSYAGVNPATGDVEPYDFN